MEKWYFENFVKVKTVVVERSTSKFDLNYTVHTSIIELNSCNCNLILISPNKAILVNIKLH